jgi:hypothetical protein
MQSQFKKEMRCLACKYNPRCFLLYFFPYLPLKDDDEVKFFYIERITKQKKKKTSKINNFFIY